MNKIIMSMLMLLILASTMAWATSAAPDDKTVTQGDYIYEYHYCDSGVMEITVKYMGQLIKVVQCKWDQPFSALP